MVLTVLAWRSSTSLAGHVTFLSAKCSRDFFCQMGKTIHCRGMKSMETGPEYITH